MQQHLIVNNIFDASLPFSTKAVQAAQYQDARNTVYQSWNGLLHRDIARVNDICDIPFLPISFFKTHRVVSGQSAPAVIFESSGTTQSNVSRHYVSDLDIYRRSFTGAFQRFYGHIGDWCIIGLLPSYLERQHSSLVLMVDELVRKSGHPGSGFYLHDLEALHTMLLRLEEQGQQTLLIGVTFALLDFAAAFPLRLQHTVVMETGGMKGRRKELTRQEVHAQLCTRLGVPVIHSEYGMTELLSQAYSARNGRFHCPPWMKVLVREEDDPLVVHTQGRGVLNIIDLANIHSCCFIATDDVGTVFPDGSFEVLGRMDSSDMRGCSLMAV